MTKPTDTKRKAKTAALADEAAPELVTITAYKAFNADWSCNGFQYEIGKSYTHNGKVALCSSGFHACTVPFDCWGYYPHSLNLARVTLAAVGADHSDDSKVVAGKITIEVSLSIPEWIKAQVETVLDLCRAAKGKLTSEEKECAAATGDRGHAAATGDSGHAAATGDSGHAAATGDSGHAAVTGKHAIAAAFGVGGTARAEIGGAIMLAAHDEQYNLVAVFASKVGENGIEAGKTYRLNADGKPEIAEAA